MSVGSAASFFQPSTPVKPMTGGIVNVAPKVANPMAGQTGAAATAGAKGAMAGMATAFAAAIVVEVVFWLLDKLTGGKLSGSAKKLDAEPADMRKTASEMQATADEMKRRV